MTMEHAELTTQWTKIGALSLRYRTNTHPHPDTTPAIVLIHGLVVSDRYMLPTARCLAPHYTIYVPDLPGYGKSDKPAHTLTIIELATAVADWMQAIGLRQAIVLGNSLGCQIVAQLATLYPERVQAAILTGATMDPRARNALHMTARWYATMPFEPFSLYPIILRDLFDIGLRRSIMTFRYGLQDRIEAQLPHMHIPTLVVRGSHDSIAPQRWVETMVQLLPNAQLAVIPGAGHAINYNSPKRLTYAINMFLQTAFPHLFKPVTHVSSES